MRMQHVITPKDLTYADVILDTVVMDLRAMVKHLFMHNILIQELGTTRNMYK
jgi:hypothetical protein